MQVEFIGGPRDGHKEKIADPPRRVSIPLKVKDRSLPDPKWIEKIYRFHMTLKIYIWEDLKKWPI